MTKSFTLTQFASGVDIQFGSGIAENLPGTANTDVFFGFGGDDTLRGGLESDFLIGESDGDTLKGEGGDDFLFYSSEAIDINYFNYGINNFLSAGSPISNANDRQFLLDEWNDVLSLVYATNPAPDADIEISGGDGFDTAILDFSYKVAAINFSFTASADFSVENISVSGIEAVWLKGSNLADTMTGGINDDRLYGFDGEDVLDGGDGKDFIFGGLNRDTLKGGKGDDFLVATDVFTQFNRAGLTQTPLDFYSGLQTIFDVNAVVSTADRLISGGDGIDTAVLDFRILPGAGVNYGIDPSVREQVANTGIQIEGVEAIWAIGSLLSDNIRGGAESDRFLTAGGAVDTFEGRGGIDWIEMSKGATGNINLTTNIHTGSVAGDTYTSIENVVGSDAANKITGNDVANELYGRGGADTLSGGAADDLLDGGAGSDIINGGEGSDTVSYATSFLKVAVDLLNPATTNTGDAAGDTYSEIENLTGTRRGDALFGNNGANIIDGGLGRDAIQGRDGDDTLIGNSGDDALTGGAGSDTAMFSGNRLDYTIVATATGFTVTDKRGANFDGADTITEVEKFIFADQTRDAANLITSAPSTPTFTQNGPLTENEPAGTVVGTLSAIDPDGSPVTYSIVGGSLQFVIAGDKLLVANGAKLDFETKPVETLTIQASDGTLLSPNGAISIELTDLDERVLGTNGPDLLKGTPDVDSIAGLGGDDTIFGSAGADKIDGGAGDDTMQFTAAVIFDLVSPEENSGQAEGDTYANIEIFKFSAGGDDIFGGDSADIFFAGAGNDTIEGRGGNDDLSGDAGADTIEGGLGKDSIIGGKGVDHLEGGGGADSFIYNNILDRGDVISDFDRVEKDKISLSLSGFGLDEDFKFTLKKTLVVNGNPKATIKTEAFLFDTDSGVLSFDSNGKSAGGVSVLLTLSDIHTLKVTDFLLFA